MEQILTGQSTEHLARWEHFLIHRQALAAFRKLRRDSAREGFDIRPVSIFRSHAQQLAIWNEKARGLRPLLGPQGVPLNYATLIPEDRMVAILRWSALPGASRHHWGTELDVYDHNALPPGKQVELTPWEVAGWFAPLHAWLDENMQRFDFFRPYARDLGGVSPEGWHLSYRPVSQQYFEQYDFPLFQKVITHPQLELRELLWENREEIFQRYFRNVSH